MNLTGLNGCVYQKIVLTLQSQLESRSDKASRLLKINKLNQNTFKL